jgi:hypothetical protein
VGGAGRRGRAPASGDPVLLEPGDARLMEMGMLGVIRLLAGPTAVPPLAPLDWPTPSMALSVRAWWMADRSEDALARLTAGGS